MDGEYHWVRFCLMICCDHSAFRKLYFLKESNAKVLGDLVSRWLVMCVWAEIWSFSLQEALISTGPRTVRTSAVILIKTCNLSELSFLCGWWWAKYNTRKSTLDIYNNLESTFDVIFCISQNYGWLRLTELLKIAILPQNRIFFLSKVKIAKTC